MTHFNQTVNDTLAASLKVSRNTLFNILDTMNSPNYATPEEKLKAIDSLLWCNGVEYLGHPDDSLNLLNGQYGISYVNPGETYQLTVIYHHASEEFYIDSWGNFIEQNFPPEDGTLDDYDSWKPSDMFN